MILLSRPDDVYISAGSSLDQAKMQSAHVVGPGEPLELKSHPLPEVPDEGLLIKTLYAGICHSDIHFIDDEIPLGGDKVFRRRDIPGKYSVCACACMCVYVNGLYTRQVIDV